MPPLLLSASLWGLGLSFPPRTPTCSTPRPLQLENEALGLKALPALRCSYSRIISLIS